MSNPYQEIMIGARKNMGCISINTSFLNEERDNYPLSIDGVRKWVQSEFGIHISKSSVCAVRDKCGANLSGFPCVDGCSVRPSPDHRDLYPAWTQAIGSPYFISGKGGCRIGDRNHRFSDRRDRLSDRQVEHRNGHDDGIVLRNVCCGGCFP